MTDAFRETRAVGIGTPLPRVDSPLKVTGRAPYAAEFPIPGIHHGVIVSGLIAKVRVTGIDRILFSGQPVALVLAETVEAARFAASLIDVSHEAEPHDIEFEASLAETFMPRAKRARYHRPKNHGDADAAFTDAAMRHEGRHRLAKEHHNPMEMHASTVDWHGEGSFTVYDSGW